MIFLSGNDEDSEVVETVYITGMVLPYISYEVTGWMLAQVSIYMEIFHTVFSEVYSYCTNETDKNF